MTALRITRPGDADVLRVEDVPQPEPAADQMLVRVAAAGLNRADIMQRRGHYPPPPGIAPDIPGLEFAGEVAAAGPEVRSFSLGQRVFGLVGGGAQAEYVVVHEGLAIAVPQTLGDVEAGGVPEAFITAHDALFTQAGLAMGERVLVHAIGSGVGLAALQIAKCAGCTVYGTSRSPDKLERAKAFGLDLGIDMSSAAFDEVIAQKTQTGVDVIIDFIGGDYLAANIRALAPRGRRVFVSTLSGTQAALSIREVMSKRLRLVGTMLRGRPLGEKIAATRAFEKSVVPLLASGRIKVPVDKLFDLSQAADAHRYLEANQNFGKVVFAVAR